MLLLLLSKVFCFCDADASDWVGATVPCLIVLLVVFDNVFDTVVDAVVDVVVAVADFTRDGLFAALLLPDADADASLSPTKVCTLLAKP